MRILFFLLFAAVAFNSCRQEGCTNPSALNYNPDADKSDGSCHYSTVLFWARYNTYVSGWNSYDVTSIQVKVKGSAVGNITLVNTIAPACGSAGSITYEMGTDSSVAWEATIHLSNGSTVTKTGTASASSHTSCLTVQVDA